MSGGPWWFAGVVGVAGIVVGVVLKWFLDAKSERRKEQREVSSRFITERQAAYELFYSLVDRAATGRVNAWTNEAILKGFLLTSQSDSMRPTSEEREVMNSFISSETEAVNVAIQNAQEQLKVMQMLSPTSICDYAQECLRVLLKGSRFEFELAERAFLATARQDLGIPSADLPNFRRNLIDPAKGWMILGTNIPWPSPPGKRYPLSLALRRVEARNPFEDSSRELNNLLETRSKGAGFIRELEPRDPLFAK